MLAGQGLSDRADFNQPLEHEVVLELERAMRRELGQLADQFSTEEILDGVTSPAEPLKAWTHSLPRLRAKLSPCMSQCATDDDLLRAARHPDQPLIVSGACRVQVLRRRRKDGGRDLHFTEADLRRRIEADLSTARRSTAIDASSPSLVTC